MKYILLYACLLYSTIALSSIFSDEIEITKVASSVGEACSTGRGQGQRKAEKICNSKQLKFSWEKTDFGECDFREIKKGSYQAKWKIKYTCKE